MTIQQTDTKPNGPVAAAFVAAGVGSLALGLMVTLAEMSADFGTFLDFSKNYGLGNGVGPLSGKVAIAVVAYIVSWIVLHFLWRGRELAFRSWFAAALVLVAIGFALTFPPIFLLFAPAE
jgi:hypothetical protein